MNEEHSSEVVTTSLVGEGVELQWVNKNSPDAVLFGVPRVIVDGKRLPLVESVTIEGKEGDFTRVNVKFFLKVKQS